MINEEVLIIKEVNYNENDKILHALSRTNGKIQLISRGCRKNNSHLVNASQLFAHSACSLTKSRDMYIITSAELIDNFYNLKNNIDAYYYANYIIELISYVAQENEYDYKIFDMTVSALHYLSCFTENFDKLTAAYELKLVSMLGYRPDFLHCLSCGATVFTDAKFSIKEGGVFCSKCVNYGNGINVTYSEILTLDKILKSKFENIGSIEVNTKLLNLIRNFLFYYIGKDNFTTLKLI
ncbi:MAG: DNA repair protein RecO [Sedimentibacter sp.]|uniref:DNA repair protein RecO n=1 Tax=Sedimentibacter sp. TaxID=1960295 RepID=UPI00298260AC|nr:DNA repair protein RecO [Sedimentibacter sp.]MDW5300344.1 DNA repair protein RecO [Sedimentibacter sp.]